MPSIVPIRPNFAKVKPHGSSYLSRWPIQSQSLNPVVCALKHPAWDYPNYLFTFWLSFDLVGLNLFCYEGATALGFEA